MNEDKKKFSETKVGKFLKGNAPHLLDIAGEALPDGGVLGAIAAAIKGDPGLTPAQKLEFERLLMEYRESEFEAVTRRWEADMGSRYALPQLVRPVVLIILTTSIVTFAAIDAADNVPFTMGTRWTELLTTMGSVVFAAYFGGRSFEKVWKK